jgi:hypothetical protein
MNNGGTKMTVIGLGKKVSGSDDYFWLRNVNKSYPVYSR